MEKDLQIAEKEKLYVELKNILARQPGPEVAEQLGFCSAHHLLSIYLSNSGSLRSPYQNTWCKTALLVCRDICSDCIASSRDIGSMAWTESPSMPRCLISIAWPPGEWSSRPRPEDYRRWLSACGCVRSIRQRSWRETAAVIRNDIACSWLMSARILVFLA